LLAAPQSQPTYPNYTLPPAEFPIPALPEFSLPGLDLIVIPTTSSPSSQGLDYSVCAVKNANVFTGSVGVQNIVVNATTEWSAVGNEEGYRTYWVIGGLSPGSNYTAWFMDGQKMMSEPIWFTTKQCKSVPLPTSQLVLLLMHSVIPVSIGFTDASLPIDRLRRPFRSECH
jgi:calcium channel MID1